MALVAETDLRAVEQFLYHEAILLDEKRWGEWLGLYTDDCFYWVPSVVDQKDPVETVSLFAEDKMRMEMRVIRVEHPRAFSQDMPTRMSHIVGNVMPEKDAASYDGGMGLKADLVVRSTVHVLEFRRDDQRSFGGTVRHWLRRSGGSWQIAMKRIDLINCDAPMEGIQLFL